MKAWETVSGLSARTTHLERTRGMMATQNERASVSPPRLTDSDGNTLHTG